MSGKVQLTVCVRVHPGSPSKLNETAFAGTKLERTRASLRSLRSAIGGLAVEVVVLLDRCPPVYRTVAEAAFAGLDVRFVECLDGGNAATFQKQCEVALGGAPLAYFAEDDYLYEPGALEEAVSFMRAHAEADFCTLYDHPDYHAKHLHRFVVGIVHEHGGWNRHWHPVASTCLSFMARCEALAAGLKVFRTFGPWNSDLGVWLALTKHAGPATAVRCVRDGRFFAGSLAMAWLWGWTHILFGRRLALYACERSLATHMQAGQLAPAVDWQEVYAEASR